MAFIRLQENLTVNTQYIVKVKWKANSTTDDLSATVFLAENDKPIVVQGEAAFKLWDEIHPEERLPQTYLSEPPLPESVARRLRRDW